MPCCARRLSRRDFEVFLLGTATAAAQYSGNPSASPRARHSVSAAVVLLQRSGGSSVWLAPAPGTEQRVWPRRPCPRDCPSAVLEQRVWPLRPCPRDCPSAVLEDQLGEFQQADVLAREIVERYPVRAPLAHPLDQRNAAALDD